MTRAQKIANSIHEEIKNDPQKYGRMELRLRDASEIGKELQKMGYKVDWDFYNNVTVIW